MTVGNVQCLAVASAGVSCYVDSERKVVIYNPVLRGVREQQSGISGANLACPIEDPASEEDGSLFN